MEELKKSSNCPVLGICQWISFLAVVESREPVRSPGSWAVWQSARPKAGLERQKQIGWWLENSGLCSLRIRHKVKLRKKVLRTLYPYLPL